MARARNKGHVWLWPLGVALALALPLSAKAQTTTPALSAETPGSPPQADLDLPFGAYQRGQFVTAFREATKRVAANASDAPAMTLLGLLYAEGYGVPRNDAEAARWYRLAAERGDAPAAFSLGLMLLEGRGLDRDRARAKALFEQAAAKGHGGALYNLGVLAIEGNGIVQDFAAAARLFRQSAEAGNADAAYSLGLLYREGRGVEQSPQQSTQWFARAAEAKVIAGEIDYAIALFNGIGTERTRPPPPVCSCALPGATIHRRQNRIARLLAAGRGTPKNLVEAMKWHVLARSAGVEDSWLDSQLNQLTPEHAPRVEDLVRRHVGG